MNLSRTIHKISAILFTILALCVTAVSSELPRRIPARINDSQTFLLPDNTPRVVVRGSAIDQGSLPASHLMPRMFLHFTMTPAQTADLNQLLQDLQDRRSPQYHKFLTPEQYAARFGLHSEDLAKVTEWLEMSGFYDIQIGRSARWVSFSGTAARAASAFHTSVHRYMIDGQTYLANTGDPRLPKSLQGIVESVRGLHNIALKPHLRRAHPNFTSSISGNNFLVPDDWATIYDVKPFYTAGQDGTGVTIAVMGQSDVALSDIQAFRSAAGLPANTPTVIVPPGDHDPGYQTSQGDETESDLDLEWAGGIAKNATILFVTASPTFGNGVEDSLTYAIDNNVAPIISLSYGQCEAQETTTDFTTQNSLYQQANAQGITIVASSGDSGATACDQGVTENAATQGLAVNFPASSQYVTGIGGTEFDEYGSVSTYWNATNNSNNGSAISYIPEIAWDDYFQSATGGGASTLVLKPAWQTGNGVPNDGWRDVPDISFAASPNHDGFLICSQGSCTNGFRNSTNNLDVIGGTSAAAPPFAGVLALMVQQKGRLGNINQVLYSLAQTSNNVFHDIFSYGNYQVCQAGTPNCPYGGSIGYDTGPGYDQATGWGSVDAYNLSQQWNSDFQISASPATLTLQPGASVTATASISPQNGFNGQVTYTCSVSSNLVGVTCSVPSTPFSASGTATVTITADSNAQLLPLPHMRIFPTWPVSSPRLPIIVGLSLLVAVSMLIGLRKHPLPGRRLIYAAGSALLLVIALGAVGCGGTSAGTTATPVTPAPVIPALTLTCSLPNAILGSQYTGSCTAAGGTAPYTYSISSGSLPIGLFFDGTSGVISGFPTTSGTASFTVQVSDQTNPQRVATQAESMVVSIGPLALSCSTLTATVGNVLSGGCYGSGGVPPYSLSIVDGALPPGIVFNSGSFSGNPTSSGTSSFTVGITDSESPAQKATQAINLVVNPGVVVINCSFPNGQTGVSYFSGFCSATGGLSPYTFSLVSGSLPPGVILINFSNLYTSGVATTAGTYPFVIKAVDSESPAQSMTQSASITIAQTQPVVISSCSYASAKVGVSYYAGSCTATGGAPPYDYTFLSGTLPPGLSVQSSGALYGQPTATGTYSFVLQAADQSAVPLTATYQVTNFVVQPRATVTGTVAITATSGNLTSTTSVTVTVP